MSLDKSKIAFSSDYNAFEMLEVNDTSITVSGSFTPGQERTWTSVITLEENQDFAYALGRYEDFVLLDGQKWRTIPTFNATVPSTFGTLTFYIYYEVTGNIVTFTAGAKDAGLGESITSPTTFDIRYVTYTTDE